MVKTQSTKAKNVLKPKTKSTKSKSKKTATKKKATKKVAKKKAAKKKLITRRSINPEKVVRIGRLRSTENGLRKYRTNSYSDT